MIKSIIFDCFGVFYPDPIFAFMRDPQTSPKKANALHELDKRAAYGELSRIKFIESASRLLDISYAEIEQQFLYGAKLNKPLLDFAQHVRKDYSTALLSNIGSDMMDGFFSDEELASLFDIVVLSGAVKMAKPDRDVFEYVLGKLGAKPEEVVFIDDSMNHIEGAKKLGIKGIQFTSNERLKTSLIALGLSKATADMLR